jgi:hypothetical protein
MKSIFQRRRTWHRKQRQSAVLTPRNQVRQLRKDRRNSLKSVSQIQTLLFGLELGRSQRYVQDIPSLNYSRFC